MQKIYFTLYQKKNIDDKYDFVKNLVLNFQFLIFRKIFLSTFYEKNLINLKIVHDKNI